jgi:uncharacterized protein YjbJ (UPF0337 family)
MIIHIVQEEEFDINNKVMFDGKWNEMRGQVKALWGKLTDDELEITGGNSQQIVGLLQMRYGYTRQRAEREFNQKLTKIKEKIE